MTLDCKDLIKETSGLLRYFTPKSEVWGQPPASNYIFTVIDKVMYGQITGSNYLSICQISGSLPAGNQMISTFENNGWLALAESAFEFWDNEQDAIFDNLQPGKCGSCSLSIYEPADRKTAAGTRNLIGLVQSRPPGCDFSLHYQPDTPNP